MVQARCPTCKKQFDTDKTPAMPFCSHRCREVDLGRWLREEPSIPVMRDDESDERPASEEQN